MARSNRIDVHQHVVPPFWAETLPAHGGDPSGWRSPDWTPQQAIAFMDSQQIETGVLSLTAPGVQGWDGCERRDMARRVNEYTAGLVSNLPLRFGHFATLPLPDVDGSLLELEHAFGALKADGVILLSSYQGRYLGDPLFESLWAELDRRNAVVFIHPSKPAIPTIEGIPGPIVDYPFDTTRTAVQLVLNGVLGRHPHVRVILSHAGGFVPYAAPRFAELANAVRPGAPDSATILETFKRFYLDTALSSGAATLTGVKLFSGVGKILYGSDYPYAPASIGAAFTVKLDTFDGLTTDEHRAINHGNARRLFPRLDRRDAVPRETPTQTGRQMPKQAPTH